MAAPERTVFLESIPHELLKKILNREYTCGGDHVSNAIKKNNNKKTDNLHCS